MERSDIHPINAAPRQLRRTAPDERQHVYTLRVAKHEAAAIADAAHAARKSVNKWLADVAIAAAIAAGYTPNPEGPTGGTAA
jgi:hypothetical protein